MLGKDAVKKILSDPRHRSPIGRRFRAFMAARSRYAEDQLARAVARGATQYVILGAGLDTFAYRNPFRNLRVFEVDHPATQLWKRELLQSANIAIPSKVVYVPIDFERQTLDDAGIDRAAMTFFSWLGVIPYLTREAAMSTLHFIASMPSGSGVAFDYAVDPSSLGFLQRAAFNALSRRVAKAGEPFRLFFHPRDLADSLKRLGFRDIEDLDSAQINTRYAAGIAGDIGRLCGAGL